MYKPTSLCMLLTLCFSSSVHEVYASEIQTYTVEVGNFWLAETHGLLPTDAHFSWFGGGVHNAETSFWDVGELASPGMKQMAEIGVTTILLNEISQEISSGNAYQTIDQNHWFCPPETTNPACGELTFQIEVTLENHRVTMVSMLGPSPDWFVGLNGFSLRESNTWIDNVSVELYPFDAGTRSANLYELGGPLSDPPEPIALITSESGQLIGPQLIGRIHFSRNVVAGDINCDGNVNLIDVQPFVDLLLSGGFQAEADINNDGTVTLEDVSGFVGLLSGN